MNDQLMSMFGMGQAANAYGDNPEAYAALQGDRTKQLIAQMLLARGMQQPQGQMVGRFYVPASPLQHVGNLAQAGAGVAGMGMADQKRMEMAKQIQDRQKAEVDKFQQSIAPQPVQQPVQGPGSPMEAPEGPVEGPQPTITTMQPRGKEEVQQAMMQAQMGTNPRLREAAKFMAQQQQMEEQKALDREQRELDRGSREEMNKLLLGQKGDALKAQMEGINLQLGDRALAREDRERLEKEKQEKDLEFKKWQAEFAAKTQTDIAGMKLDAAKGMADTKAAQKGGLPAPALKLAKEELDGIGIAAGINADMGGIQKQIESGKLKLGLVDNLIGTARNFTGISTEDSRNLQSFKATVEKMRNDSLRLNKGVQTEGDAKRAWNELFANLNDPKAVTQRLAEIQALNERAVNIRKMNVDMIYKNYGAEPPDMSGYTNQPAAVGNSGALSPQETAELEQLRKKYGR